MRHSNYSVDSWVFHEVCLFHETYRGREQVASGKEVGTLLRDGEGWHVNGIRFGPADWQEGPDLDGNVVVRFAEESVSVCHNCGGVDVCFDGCDAMYRT